ncbi:MAG: hypothetical protein K6A44_04425 [bacterium]|nr:hypothetical protein [bacterium]
MLNLLKQDPVAFVKNLTKSLGAYFEFYALLQYQHIVTFTRLFDITPFLQITGVSGSGKSSFKSLIKGLFAETTKVFEYNCSEVTELDDIFYALYKFSLRNPIIRKDAARSGVSTFKPNSLDEQILYYLKNSPSNLVLIFDGFENLADEQGNMRAENMKSFLEYLSVMKNIKVVIMSNYDISKSLALPENSLSSIELHGLDENQIKDFLAIYKVDSSPSVNKEIYDLSGGYIYQLKLLAIVSRVFNLPVGAVLKEKSMRREDLVVYLIKKLITKLSDEELNILTYFSVFRHEISLSVLKCVDSFVDVSGAISNLQRISLLEGEDNFEARTIVRNIVYATLGTKEKMYFHERIADFYANQIPLKPSERVLEISRISMYSEKFYHYNIYSKLSKSASIQSARSQTSVNPAVVPQDVKPDAQTIQYIASTKYLPDFEMKDKPASAMFNIEAQNDEEYLDSEEKDFMNFSPFKPPKDILAGSKNNNPVEEINSRYMDNLNDLNMIEDNDLMKAQDLLQKGNDAYLQGNTEESITYLKSALPLLQDKDNSSFYLAKYTLARAYSDNFDYDNALIQLKELMKYDIPADLQVEVIIEQASVMEFQEKGTEALSLYNKALSIAKANNNKALCSKAYFKIALYYDDKNDTDKALYNYLLSATDAAELQDKSMLGSTYSNIASIYEEKNDTQKAVEFYKKSLKVDEYYKNFEGQTKSLSSLGGLLMKKNDINTAISVLLKATQCAKQTEDSYMIAASYLELGDAFFRKKDYKNALKSYMLSKKNIDSTISTDSKNKIERRFDMIVDEIGEKAYRFLLQELRTK